MPHDLAWELDDPVPRPRSPLFLPLRELGPFLLWFVKTLALLPIRLVVLLAAIVAWAMMNLAVWCERHPYCGTAIWAFIGGWEAWVAFDAFTHGRVITGVVYIVGCIGALLSLAGAWYKSEPLEYMCPSWAGQQ